MDSVLHTSRGGFVLIVCGWMSLLFLVSFFGYVGPVSSIGADVAAAAAPSAMTPPTECSMPSDMMVSGNNCSYYDEQSMDGLMGGCREFLTNTENAPTQDCCFGVNQVAYARTPCFCKGTFYPLDSAVDASGGVNVTRQKLLPGLCLVTLDLCNLCLDFVSPLGTGVPSPGSSSKLHRTGMAILKLLLALLLVGAVITITLLVYRTYKARNGAAAKEHQSQTYVASVPGGSY
ncbi:unnamed protein product [Sphagnum tenellum]